MHEVKQGEKTGEHLGQRKQIRKCSLAKSRRRRKTSTSSGDQAYCLKIVTMVVILVIVMPITLKSGRVGSSLSEI